MTGFGYDKVVSVYDQYIGKWIIINSMNGVNSAGKLVGIDEGYMVLNPHQGLKWDPEKGMSRGLVKENSLVESSKIASIDPTTRRDLEAFCTFKNNEEEKRDGNGEDISKKAPKKKS